MQPKDINKHGDQNRTHFRKYSNPTRLDSRNDGRNLSTVVKTVAKLAQFIQSSNRRYHCQSFDEYVGRNRRRVTRVVTKHSEILCIGPILYVHRILLGGRAGRAFLANGKAARSCFRRLTNSEYLFEGLKLALVSYHDLLYIYTLCRQGRMNRIRYIENTNLIRIVIGPPYR